MAILLGFLLIVSVIGLLCLLVALLIGHRAHARLEQEANEQRVQLEAQLGSSRDQAARLSRENARLARWTAIADADEAANTLIANAKAILAQAESDARILIADAEHRTAELLESARLAASEETADARRKSKELRDDAQALIDTAMRKAADVVADAEKRAEEIAGAAYAALRNAALYEKTARAMKNIIDGYGDEYLVPVHSLLADLAEEFGHAEAGQELKRARAHTKMMIKSGDASQCEYVEQNRREMAERFVLDAFNGKTDSILTRVKHDNAGKLSQEIHDAFTMVNFNGKAFRDARVTEQYLASRLDELKWAATVHELKRQEQDEQRRIREQIREEEKARKEIERAIRESAQEEEVLRKAMAAAQLKISEATETQRAQYEAQLLELTERLQMAEARNQRAISMAQQTKRGHVYIISNVGSFGDNVYKIGLTRRLDPLDRIWELGDSSVPFDFDVHAMVFCEDAPAVERQLHKHFLMTQMNKVDHRKEFFRVNLAHIREELDKLGIVAHWTMAAEAREYRETHRIEEIIADDPAAREAWINRQLTLDPVAVMDTPELEFAP